MTDSLVSIADAMADPQRPGGASAQAALQACRPILADLQHRLGGGAAARALVLVDAALADGVKGCASASRQCDSPRMCQDKGHCIYAPSIGCGRPAKGLCSGGSECWCKHGAPDGVGVLPQLGWRPIAEFDYEQQPRIRWLIAQDKHVVGECFWGYGHSYAHPVLNDEPHLKAWRYVASSRRVPDHLQPTHFMALPDAPSSKGGA